MAKTLSGWTDADGNPTYLEDMSPRRKDYSIGSGPQGSVPKVAVSNYEKPEPTTGETIQAYARQSNWLWSSIADKTTRFANRIDGTVDNTNRFDGSFDIDSELAKHPDLEAYKDKLSLAQNQRRFDSVAAQIRMELEDKDTIDRTKGFIPNAVGMVGAVADPSLLIPGTAIVKGAKTISTVAKTVTASAGIGAATGLVQGAVVDATQLTGDSNAARDYAAYGAVGGALFGGWVGSRAAKAMTDQAKKDAIAALAQSHSPLPTSGNAGAMKVNPSVIPDGEKLPVIEGLIKGREKTLVGEKGILRTPNMQLATSESETVRKLGQELGNNALYTEKNLHGVATPQSFELNMKQLSTSLEGRLATLSRDSFNSFKTGYSKINFSAMADELKNVGKNITADELSKMKPSRELFNELVAVSTRNGDVSAIHEIELAAKGTRKIYQELGDTANNQNLFENLHKQAERNALKEANTKSAPAVIHRAAIEAHTRTIIAKQAAQLLRLKDRLYELKSLGKDQSKNATRLGAAITRAEDNLAKKDGGEALKKVHQEFADRLKAANANVTDTATRKQLARTMFNERRGLVNDSNLNKQAAKANLTAHAEQAAKVARQESESLTPTTAKSYFPRMWDIEKVMANEQELKSILANHYIQKGVPGDEAKLLVDDLFENMKNTQQGVNKGNPELASSTFGSMNARSIDIPDNLVGKFLINDHNYVTNQYIGDMSRAIEFDKAFGGRSMAEVLDDVGQDFKAMREEVYAKGLSDTEQSKLIANINRNERSDMANLKHLYNTLMGKGKDIDFISASTSSTIKKVVNITSLGQIVAASLTDLGRVVSVSGFGRPLKAAANMFSSEFRKLTKEEAEQFGYGFERLLSTRANQLIDVDNNVMNLRPNMFEKGVNGISSKFHELTLFNRWNSSMKHMAGLMHADKSMKAVLDYDNLDKHAQAYLAQAGIDRDIATRIAEQYSKFGVDEKSFKFGNTALWDDEVAKTTYQRAVYKLTNHTIMTPDAGTVPTVFKSNIGSVVTQFMSFTAAAEEQMLAAGIQRHSVNEVKGLLTMFGAGMAGVVLKDFISGKEDTPIEDIILRGIDATGIFGVAGDLNKRLHTGGLGIQDLFDDEEERKVDGMRAMSAMAGPGINKGLTTATALINIANGSGGERERSDIWKSIPGNNIWAVKFLADRYGPEINSRLGE